MKKVLIITYYWPPAGGPGVQRVLKFAKYLPEFGWQPVILTVKNGEYPAYDESLRKDIPDSCKVYKTPALEPFSIYKKFTGMAEDEQIPTAALTEKKINWKKKVAHWIRLNLFVPDAKIGWIPFAVKAGKHIIQKENPDIIFSSSPPPTVHLIAKSLARWSKIKWVTDFRDPWTDIYHYEKNPQNLISKWYNKNIEKNTLFTADRLISVSKNVANLLKKKAKSTPNISIITNGYDEDDFNNINVSKSIYPEKFKIVYTGKITDKQNPLILWKILSEITKKNSEFSKNLKIILIGSISQSIIKDIQKHNLQDYLENLDYLEHNKAISYMYSAQILLLLIPNTSKNKGIVTGKLFEYLASRNFIIGIGPEDGDAAEILQKSGAGKMFEFDEETELKKEIRKKYKNWKNGKKIESENKNIKIYSRKKLTYKLIKNFN